MKRLTGILFAAAALALPITTCAQGVAERTEAKVDKALELLHQLLGQKPPIVEPKPPNPTTPTNPTNPATPSWMKEINGAGQVFDVCTCSPALVRLRNLNPMTGASVAWAKTPGTGSQAVPLGVVTVSESGVVRGSSGSVVGRADIGIGDRDLIFTSDPPCMNLTVSVVR
jgi:hypothetical protein